MGWLCKDYVARPWKNSVLADEGCHFGLFGISLRIGSFGSSQRLELYIWVEVRNLDDENYLDNISSNFERCCDKYLIRCRLSSLRNLPIAAPRWLASNFQPLSEKLFLRPRSVHKKKSLLLLLLQQCFFLQAIIRVSEQIPQYLFKPPLRGFYACSRSSQIDYGAPYITGRILISMKVLTFYSELLQIVLFIGIGCSGIRNVQYRMLFVGFSLMEVEGLGSVPKASVKRFLVTMASTWCGNRPRMELMV